MLRHRILRSCVLLMMVAGFAPGVLQTRANALRGIPVAELFPEATFDPAIPTQLDVLGFSPGARPVRHAELLRYLEKLAEVSPRAEMQLYSSTHEGRPMVVLAVSDESTMKSELPVEGC